MRILVLAPDQPDISWAAELETVTQNHNAVVLAGKITQERITNATSGELFDCIHVIAHAGDEGVDMAGWIMTPAQLAQIANHVRARMVFLNVCRSLFLPQYLIDQHVPAVLSHTRANGVLDRDALQLASFFYQELIRKDGDYRKAYEEVSPRDGSLMWCSNGAYYGIYEPIIRRLDTLEVGRKVQTKWLIGVTFSISVEAAILIADLVVKLTG